MKKKKFLTMLLASTMLLGSTMTAFAAEGEQTIENMGNITSKEVDVDSNFNVPIQDLSKLKITIPTNLDLNLLQSTDCYQRDGIIKAEGELASNCVLTVALAPTIEYTLSSDSSVKVYADNDYHQVVSGLAYWKSDELAQEGGSSRNFTISRAANKADKVGNYTATVDFKIKCHLVESADALSDYFVFEQGGSDSGFETRYIEETNITNFNNYCANNGGTMELPTFVLVDDVIYPITSFCLSNNYNYISSVRPTLSAVTSLVIPEGYERVISCGGLGNCTSVTLPNSLTDISTDAFCYMPNLTSIKIPSKNITIQGYAFRNSGLTSFEADVFSFQSEDQFSGCTSLRTVKLSGRFMDIPAGCFNGCTALEELTIPESVRYLYGGFYNCTSLRTVNYGGTMLQFKNISGVSYLTDSSYNSGDLTVNCSDGTLHYTNGVLDE